MKQRGYKGHLVAGNEIQVQRTYSQTGEGEERPRWLQGIELKGEVDALNVFYITENRRGRPSRRLRASESLVGRLVKSGIPSSRRQEDFVVVPVDRVLAKRGTTCKGSSTP